MMRHWWFSDTDGAGDGGSVEWVLLNGLDDNDRAWIRSQGELGTELTQALLDAPEQTTRQHFEPATLIGLVRAATNDSDDVVGLKILTEARRVIVVCFGVESLVDRMLTRHAIGNSPVDASRLLQLFVLALVHPLEPEITRMSDTVDDLEDGILGESGNGKLEDVVKVGRRVLGVRRYLLPMRDELSFLACNPEEMPGVTKPRHLLRTAEYLDRLVASLDSSHHRVNLLLGHLRNHDEARLARSMHKLALVATVFLPLTFITGLLGINVAGIPDARDPMAFWLVCALLFAMALLAVLVIRRRHWM
ncbi:MAG: CorA family divalent cation transporter [Pseudomonadota bacterium]|nr:CorA family divalent cation transporter [Pseudomonadota bacterium]